MERVLFAIENPSALEFQGVCWRRRWDSNPRALTDNRISSAARYDRFDTSPKLFCTEATAMTASIRLHIDHALRDQVRKAFFVRKKYNKSTKPIYHKS